VIFAVKLLLLFLYLFLHILVLVVFLNMLYSNLCLRYSALTYVCSSCICRCFWCDSHYSICSVVSFFVLVLQID
jgi:hypothetical protein